jgi:hypothetical protein
MREYYKRTFWVVQAMSGFVCWAAYSASGHNWRAVAVFFAAMQLAAVAGAAWANRLRRKMTNPVACRLDP